MTLLKDYRREMIRRAAGDGVPVGRLLTPSAIAAQSVTATALAYGTAPSSRFQNQWMVRADSTSNADRVRLVSGYQSATGQLSHAGTAYVDTTATSETVELLQFEPYLYDLAINETVGRLKRVDRVGLPTVNGQRRYWIGDLSWIHGPGDIVGIGYSPDPMLTRNRYFEKWLGVDTNGNLTPDTWILAGSGASITRSTTGNRRGTYTAAITRAGTNVTLTQSPGLLETGYSLDTMRGRTAYAICVVTASSASQVRVGMADGVNTTYSSYHSGGGGIEELDLTFPVDKNATKLDLFVSVEVDGTVYVDECYASIVGDASVKRDSYPEAMLAPDDYAFEQGAGTPALILPPAGLGTQYVVYSQRPYPQFDSTRILSGTADGDTCDAPLVTVVAGALGRLFEGLSMEPGVDTTRFAAIAQVWNKRFDTLALMHVWRPDMRGPGMPVPLTVGPNPARRA